MRLEKFKLPPVILSEDDLRRCREIALNRSDAIRKIATEVAAETNVPVAAIYGRSRRQAVVEARQLVMYISAMNGISQPVIGMALNRDPSTIHHGIAVERNRRAVAAK